MLGLSAMYLGTAMSILWTVQTMTGESLYEIMLPILPVCCVCITARTVIYKMREWIVLYLVDVKPENRIAVQYMGNIDSV